MMSRKKSFFEFWRSKKERQALLQRTDKLRLSPSQLRQLLGDSGVREKLQNARVAPLLPPVGMEVFRRFTPASLEGIKQEQEQQRRKNKEVSGEDLPKPTSDLEAGKPLPFFYGAPPTKLLNTPLEELDPFYQSQKTFMVLSKGNLIHRFNTDPACNLLNPFSMLRTIAIKILIHSLFRWFIMVTILTNCVFMMMTDPPAWSKIAEYVFIAIYTFEAIIKILSRGFCVGHFTFLRDPWNWLDVIIISTAYLTEFVEWGNNSVMMGFRVIRVLKLITVIPGLRMTVGTLLQLVNRLADVIIMIVFFLSVFALIGLQLFMGQLKHKCVMLPFSNLTFDSSLPGGNEENGSSGFNYHEYINNPVNHYFTPPHFDALLCGNTSDAGSCPEGYSCLKAGRNPNYGFTSYDSIGWAYLATFRLMTQDFWENLAQLILHGGGKSYMIYFVIVLFLGSFYMFSLLVAVVAMATAEHSEASVAEAKRREEEFTEILQALKKSEEETELSDKKDSAPQRKNNLAAEIKNHKQEHTAMEGFEEDHRSCPPCCFSFANLFLKWNCCGCWRWLKQRLYTFVMDPFFNLGITVCLILNTIFMAMEHYPMAMGFDHLLVLAHLIFTGIFTIEMILKIVAMDPHGYFQVGWNIFDSTIILLNLVELLLADVEGLSILRCFRLMRVFQLAKSWPTFNMLLRIMRNSMGALRNLVLVLVIMVFLFSVIGMQLFSRSYVDNVCHIAVDCTLPRWHMADLFHAFLIIIRILCGEWIETMWDCMEVSGQGMCLIFFIMVVVIGKLLVLSLFMALLLANMAAPDEEEGGNNLPIAIKRIKRAVACTKTWILEHICMKHVNPDDTAVNREEDNKKEYLALTFVTSDQPASEVKTLGCSHSNLTSSYDNTVSGRVPIASEIDFETPENKEKQQHSPCDDVQKVQENEDDKDHGGKTPDDCCCDKCYQCCPFLDIDTSRGIWRVWSNLRRCCLSVVEHNFFEMFITFIILLSCASLAFEDVYLEERQVLKVVLEYADLVFTWVFVVEMILKVVAFGFKRYFTNYWCWLDFLVVIVSLVSVTGNMLGYCGLKPIKCLRTLRTLSRFQSMRVVVDVLLCVIPSIIDMLLVSLVVWLFFSIFGVNLFAEANFTGIRWKNTMLNYDNVIAGYLSLLQLATLKGWLEIMYAAVDSTMVESQPVYENNPYMYLYFICFTISSFFLLNLFIRVFINTINQLRHKFGGNHVFLTEEQKMYYRTKKMRFSNNKPQTPVPRPQNKFQALVFDLVIRQCFEVFMIVIIHINMVILMVETDDLSIESEIILYWFHFAFIIIFTIESILKIIALGRRYFRDAWNILDFVLVILSIINLFLADLIEKYFGPCSTFTVIRLVRILRILPLIPGAEGIRSLLWALKMSLPALFNIGLLLVFIMFTFSVIGMSTFAYVKKGAMIDDLINFETFWSSMTCMFITTTTAGWDGLLHPIMVTPPDCDPDIDHPGTSVSGDCGNPTVGVIFFSSYIIISFLLLVSMYIAIILEVFDMAVEDSRETLSEDDLQMFYNTWKNFDPDASQCIQYSKLSEFCDTLKYPLRIPKPNTIKLIHMDLPLLPGDKIHYLDILLALRAQVFGDSGQMDALKANMEEKFKAKHTSKMSYEPISSTLRRKQEDVAAAVIQRAYRKQKLVSSEGTEGRISQLNGDGEETETEPATTCQMRT